MMTFWAMECSPLYSDDDLTKLDDFGVKLLTNRNVIKIDQDGRPAEQIVGGAHQIWRIDNGDGSCTVGLFNLGDREATLTARWELLGMTGSQPVRDLWNETEQGVFGEAFSKHLRPHECALIRIGAPGKTRPLAVSGLTSQASDGSVALTWNPSPRAAGYNVWRSIDGLPGSQLLVSGIHSAKFTDEFARNGVAYSYQVAPISALGASVKSAPVFAAPVSSRDVRAIGVQFAGLGIPMSPMETAGVVPIMGWNYASTRCGHIDLKDNSGNSSGATIKYDAGGAFRTSLEDRPGNNRLIESYLETYQHDTTTIKVSNLPAWLVNSGYDIYVYSSADTGKTMRSAKFSIGSQSVTLVNAPYSLFNGSFQAPTAKGGNYALFSSLTDSSFELKATPASSTDEYLRAPINGLEIVAHQP
jgi:hypothetical protein